MPQQLNVATEEHIPLWLISLRNCDHISQEGPWMLSRIASLFLCSVNFPSLQDSYCISYPLSGTPYSQLAFWDDLTAYFTERWILKNGVFSFHYHWSLTVLFHLLHGVNGLPALCYGQANLLPCFRATSLLASQCKHNSLRIVTILWRHFPPRLQHSRLTSVCAMFSVQCHLNWEKFTITFIYHPLHYTLISRWRFVLF